MASTSPSSASPSLTIASVVDSPSRSCVPAGTQLREGESTTDAIVRLGLALEGEVLAIQGPPGSGKTTAAAELIRKLLDAGKKVGVTATSHAVIGNVLK